VNRRTLSVLAFLFVLSGAAGLFYEAVWSRYLSLFVGHDAYAQILTLVIFLGGMGLGALVVSRRSPRIRDPLFTYAVVEALIGLLGLAFHDTIYLPVTGWAYEHLFPALGGGTAVVAAKWGLAALLILPQSILLGATFPLMSAGALRRIPEQPGRTLSILYFTNSLGAAVGVLVAGFWLYRIAGLPGTLSAAAILNLLVAVGAMVVCRTTRLAEARIPPPEAAQGSRGTEAPVLRLSRLVLTLAAGTALASFIYEVGWIRMLSLVLGSSTHSFELMLSAFILGLALGAWWVRSRVDRFAEPLRALAIVQLVMGALAIASLPLYLESFYWAAALQRATARSESGYALFTVTRYLICLAIMLPATVCAGMTLPLMTRMLLVGGAGERAIGAVYGANTLGSIVGAAITGLLLLPVLGLKGALVVGGALDMLLGLLVLRALARTGRPAPGLAFLGAGALAVLAGLVLWRLPWDQRLLSSGVFRVSHIVEGRLREILFHADGRTATVHVAHFRTSGTRVLSTNGKPDGSLSVSWFESCDTVAPPHGFSGDDGTQTLLALVLLAHAPKARAGAVIGLGTGMSSHFLLGSPAMERLTTVEIEPAIVAASKVFLPANHRAYDDPRSHIVIDDARSYFASTDSRFDLLLSEPSNPWVSGVSGLFTTEFYARVRRYIAPGGVFGQWLQTYELNDGLVVSVLAALHENFADYRVFQIDDADLLVVASPTGVLPRPDWSVIQFPAVQKDLCRFRPLTSAALDRTLILDRGGLAPLLARGAPANSDFYPVLDLSAESARFLQGSAAGVANLGTGVTDYLADPGVARAGFDTATASALALSPTVRAMQLAANVRRSGSDSAWTGAVGAAERYLLERWTQALAGDHPPANWRGWTTDFWVLVRALHGGGAPSDTAFFARARAYAGRAGAPAPVHAAIGFGEAITRRDFAAAEQPAEILLGESRAGRVWVPADDFLDGAVRAFLAAGRADRARGAYDHLRALSSRAAGDLRLALLNSYIEGAGQKAR